MVIAITTKSGKIYNTRALELINDDKDVRIISIATREYVYIQTDQIIELRLV